MYMHFNTLVSRYAIDIVSYPSVKIGLVFRDQMQELVTNKAVPEIGIIF